MCVLPGMKCGKVSLLMEILLNTENGPINLAVIAAAWISSRISQSAAQTHWVKTLPFFWGPVYIEEQREERICSAALQT